MQQTQWEMLRIFCLIINNIIRKKRLLQIIQLEETEHWTFFSILSLLLEVKDGQTCTPSKASCQAVLLPGIGAGSKRLTEDNTSNRM